MPPVDEKVRHDVVLLFQQGMSRRAIARALKMSRNTVREILSSQAVARTVTHSALLASSAVTRRSPLDPHRPRIEQLLATYPDITAQRVFEELRSAGFQGGYNGVKVLVRRLRPKPPPKPSLETPPREPGDLAECDWSSYKVDFTHAPAMELQAFSYALRYSTRKYFGFHEGNGLHPLMDGHRHAFERFQGAARRCKYDSQKPVVLRWEGGQPIFNLRFIDFATYYEFAVVACKPRSPNHKPRVERSFWELTMSFFRGRSFRDMADLRAQLVPWMDTIADLRPLKRMKRRTRMELFAEEAPLLRPLPQHPYDTARVLYKLCDIEGFIAWEGNWYSLQYEYVTQILPVRVTENELFVYKADLTCIARHELLPRGAQQKSILPGHRPRHAEHGPPIELLRSAFENLGDGGACFLAALEKREPRSAAYHARKVLALREGYESNQLLKALAHALDYGALEHGAVERILLARGTRRRLDEYIAEASAKRLANDATPQTCTEERDLAEYDALPCRGSAAHPHQGEAPCPSDAFQSSKAPPPKSGSASDNTSSDSG